MNLSQLGLNAFNVIHVLFATWCSKNGWEYSESLGDIWVNMYSQNTSTSEGLLKEWATNHFPEEYDHQLKNPEFKDKIRSHEIVNELIDCKKNKTPPKIGLVTELNKIIYPEIPKGLRGNQGSER